MGHTDLDFQQPAAVRLEVAVVNLAHGVHVFVPDLLGHGALVGQQELVEEPAVRGDGEAKTSVRREETAGSGSGSRRWWRNSPVLEQSVLRDLVIGHWLPEGVDLLQDELSDLGHSLEGQV